MSIKKRIILGVAIAIANMSSLCTVANAATYVEKNGTEYITKWENYDYSDGFEGIVTLKDYRDMPATFARNVEGKWVSDPLTVTGSESCDYHFKYFTFEFNPNNVIVHNYETGKEITNKFIKDGQKIYIVSEDNPMNLRIKFTPILVAEN